MTGAWFLARNIIFSPAGFGYLASIFGILALFSLMRLRMELLVLAVFPGTLFHELCHLLASMLFGGKVTSFRLLPKRVGRSFILGSVECGNVRWYNGFFIGLAPLLLLPVAFGLLLWRLKIWHGLHLRELPWIYLIACLTYAAIPSRQDLCLAAKSRWALCCVATVACLFWTGWIHSAYALLRRQI